ncbi:hypothetical protein BRCON_0436 [Candidatus Sumerlaea chitinivorans]|uniref:Uncharacterized protein n=1 Tax=Sumerlaea chitinivorans TaxID=2250252 RepID=A0A2Z4Y3W2_SUMC1|nr:hypothetical protein BRCON_0436 [Candidatus Sumerlaea chitinivorans]
MQHANPTSNQQHCRYNLHEHRAPKNCTMTYANHPFTSADDRFFV